MSKRDYEVDIAVSGGAGRISYALLPLLVDHVFENTGLGYDYRVNLRLLEIPEVVANLGGLAMELADFASPHLGEVSYTTDPNEAFDGVDVAILLGGVPRGAGMDRADLIAKNAPVFAEQGRALNMGAADNAKVLIVGNPANSNTLVALSHAPNMKPNQFAAMSRLDHNRAVSRLALQFADEGVTPDRVEQMAIWANHSKSMVVDISSATVWGRDVLDGVNPELPDWYADYAKTIAERGDAIIEARGGQSSVMSAAKATADQLRDWIGGSEGRWHSMGLYSDGSRADIPEGIVSAMTVTTKRGGVIKPVQIFRRYDEIEARKQASYDELLAERAKLEEIEAI